MSYNIIEQQESGDKVRVTFSEKFATDLCYVEMKVEIEGDQAYTVDFNSPAQVESCMWQMQEYLRRCEIFRRDDLRQAGGEAAGYGKD